MGFLHDVNEKRLTADDLEAAARAVGQLPVTGSGRLTSHSTGNGTVLGVRDGPNTGGMTFVARVVETDSGDFTDERYYIALQTPVGGTDDTQNLLFSEGNTAHDPAIVVAHNLAEWADGGGTHTLPTDGTRYVKVTAVEDHAGSTRWVMSETASEVFRFQVTTAIDASSLNQNYFLAKMYGPDGTTLVGSDVPILRRQAHFVGQDILAVRLPNGTTAYANDKTLYHQGGGAPTSPYNVKIQWEEIRGPQIVLCYHFVPFAGEGSAYTSRGGWYDAYIKTYQQIMPTGADDGSVADTPSANDQPCVFFNWLEQGMAGGKFRGNAANHALGMIMGYTATTPPVPIVYAVGGLPPGGALTHSGTSAWSRGADGGFSDITVLTDVSLTIDFTAQTFTLTKHTQKLTWDGYGWISVKTAQT